MSDYEDQTPFPDKEFIDSASGMLCQIFNDTYLPPKDFSNLRLRYYNLTPTTDYDRNTKVVVEGIPSKGYYGNVIQYYNRLDISQVFPSITVHSLDPVDMSKLFPIILKKSGCDLSIGDFIDFGTITLTDGQSTTFGLTVADTSLQWTGAISITILYGASWLDTEILTNEISLTTLVHPSGSDALYYGKMLTWGYDFSFAYRWLKPNSRWYMTDFASVLSLALRLGLPEFTNNQVQDLPTSQVTGSNQAFQRVVLLSNTGNSQIVGPLYFHYNPI